MICLPKKALCALEAVLDIALNARPDPVCMSALTERQGVPKRYLERVMQDLVHAGILTGHRGPHGGYRLARERRRITLRQIVCALEGLQDDSDESKEKTERTSPLGRDIIQPLCENLDREIMSQLDKITLEDLKHRTDHMIKSEAAADFHI